MRMPPAHILTSGPHSHRPSEGLFNWQRNVLRRPDGSDGLTQVGSWKLFSTIHIVIIFFLFGITLETSELKTAFKSWQVLIMGFTMILVGTALTGFVPLHMNFKPAAFGIGMAVFAACPTSLSQGVTVVIQVGFLRLGGWASHCHAAS